MARFNILYNEDGSIENTLIFDGVSYKYTMREDEENEWFVGDNKSFEYQIQEKFPDLYPEEVIDLVSEVCYYTNSNELQDIIMELTHYE